MLFMDTIVNATIFPHNVGLGANPLLPLPKKAPKILVSGTHADNLGYQCGGWTIEWDGFNGNNYTKGSVLSHERKRHYVLLLTSITWTTMTNMIHLLIAESVNIGN